MPTCASNRLLSPLFAAGLLVGASACTREVGGTEVPGAEAARLLLNRNWLDVPPATRDTRLHVFRFVPQMGGGVFQDRTLFFGTFELFQFEHGEREIRFNLPHTDEKRLVSYRIERISPKQRGDFDLRLVLERSPRGPGVYYGWSREAAGHDGESLDAHLQQLAER